MEKNLIDEFETKGFLKFENYLTPSELTLIDKELSKFKDIDAKEKYVTENGFTVYGIHDLRFGLGSEVFRNLSISSRFLGVAQVCLNSTSLYIYNSKVNCKNKFYGSNMHWHQDYHYWKLDGVPQDNLLTFLILPRTTTELDGCLYVIPGSHKAGLVEHTRIFVGEHKQFAVNSTSLSDAFNECRINSFDRKRRLRLCF